MGKSTSAILNMDIGVFLTEYSSSDRMTLNNNAFTLLTIGTVFSAWLEQVPPFLHGFGEQRLESANVVPSSLLH